MNPDLASKTHHSAVVLVPPQTLWGPIQAIREAHDAHARRWMPHVTLLYPFLPPDRYAEAEPKLEAACREIAPFKLELATFRYFAGPRTAWLDPSPAAPIVRLQDRLQQEFPSHDDVRRFPNGFQPHLSVGQGPADLPGKLQAAWKPIEFEVCEVALIRRDGPDDPFRYHRVFPLG